MRFEILAREKAKALLAAVALPRSQFVVLPVTLYEFVQKKLACNLTPAVTTARGLAGGRLPCALPKRSCPLPNGSDPRQQQEGRKRRRSEEVSEKGERIYAATHKASMPRNHRAKFEFQAPGCTIIISGRHHVLG